MKRRLSIRRSGFVLIMTLVLLSIAAVMSASIARQSFSLSAAANEEIEALRRRWGVASCRRTMFEVSGRVLQRRVTGEDGEVRLVASPIVSAELTLSGHVYELTLADEQAKADVNTLAVNLSDGVLRSKLTEIVGGAGRLVVELDPMPLDSSPERRAYQSWGHLFRPSVSAGGTIDAWELESATRLLTCWSAEGRLLLRSASEESVTAIGGLVLSPIETAELLSARQGWDGRRSAELVASLAITERKRELLATLFTDSSESTSLWVHVRRGSGTRHYFFVSSAIEGGVVKRYAFSW